MAAEQDILEALRRGLISDDVARQKILESRSDVPLVPADRPVEAAPQGSALGRVAGAFAEPFQETQFGLPEAATEAFQGGNPLLNQFNDFVLKGVVSPLIAGVQALGNAGIGTIDALAQAAIEAGIDRTKANAAARDLKGGLEAAPAFGGAVPATAGLTAPLKRPPAVFPQTVSRNVAEAVLAKTAPRTAKAVPGATPASVSRTPVTAPRGAAVSKIDGLAFKKLRNTLARDVGSKKKADELLGQWAQAGGAPDALIDLGGANMKRLARVTADISPDKALTRLTRFIQEQPEQIRGQVGRTISKKIGVADDELDAIQFVKATEGSAKYKAIEDVLIPVEAYNSGVKPLFKSTIGKQAVRKAKKIADLNDDQEMVDVLNLVLKGEEPTLSIRAIQLIKEEGLDDIIGRVKRKGGKTGKLTERKNQWLKAIDDAVPDYKDARDFYAGQFETEEAIDLGRQFMRPGKSNQVIKRELARMNPSEKEFYRVGVADSIDDFIARKGDTADKAKLIKTEAMRRKIRVLTEEDPDAANEFIDFLEASSKQFERRRFISPDTGSQTASRSVDIIESGAIDIVTGGGPRQLIRGGAKALSTAARTRAKKAMYEELADAFFVGKGAQ